MNNYLIYEDEASAQKWFDDNFKDFIDKIYAEKDTTGTLGEIISGYTGSMSRIYNELLIACGGLKKFSKLKLVDENHREYVNEIMTMANSFYNKIPNNIVLFHYCDLHAIRIVKRNSEFCLNKFISTSLLKKFPEYEKFRLKKIFSALFVINTPKGTPCIPIGNDYTTCLREYEVILHPDVQLRMLKKYFSFADFIMVIECEVIN